MKLAVIAYGCTLLGVVIGFFLASLLAAAKRGDHHLELIQAFEAGKRAALQDLQEAA